MNWLADNGGSSLCSGVTGVVKTGRLKVKWDYLPFFIVPAETISQLLKKLTLLFG